MWPSHQVLSQLHYLSDHRLGLPSAGPTKAAHPGEKPGQPRCLLGSSDPGFEHLQLLRPGPPWTQATEGAGPIPPARSQAAIYKPKPGEVKWLRRRGSRPPAPTPTPSPSPSPHGFLFPSPHSSPASHCPASSVWTTCRHLSARPLSPTVAGQQGPFSSSPPGTPWVRTPRSRPSHPDPAHSGLPKAHSHTSQFPFALGKAPTPVAATTLPVPPEDGLSGRPSPPQEPRRRGASGGLRGHISGQEDPATTLLELSFCSLSGLVWGTGPHAGQNELGPRGPGPEEPAGQRALQQATAPRRKDRQQNQHSFLVTNSLTLVQSFRVSISPFFLSPETSLFHCLHH